MLLLAAFMQSSLNLWAPVVSACAGVQQEEPMWELHLVAYRAFSSVFSLACNLYLLVVFGGFCCFSNPPAVPSGDGVGGQVCFWVALLY